MSQDGEADWQGFLNFVDHVFWHLSFASIKRERAYLPVSEAREHWTERFTATTNEHKAEGALQAAGGKMESVVGCGTLLLLLL